MTESNLNVKVISVKRTIFTTHIPYQSAVQVCGEMSNNAGNSTIIGPLNFSNDPSPATPAVKSIINPIIDVQCLLCDTVYTFYERKDDYLSHLYLEHRLIIGDEEDVAIFHEYLIYWRSKIDGDAAKLPDYCTTLLMDQLPDGTPSKDEKYYLLCDVLPADNELRRILSVKRLEAALAQHQYERTDTTYERNCLYCRDVVRTTRADFLEHLFSKHFLQLGKSENLVFIDELIETVQNKMISLICLFCEKKFKDRSTLKEHMRKKGHKRINPDISSYDKFFLINYRNENQRSYGQRTKNQRIKQRTQPKAQPKAAKTPPKTTLAATSRVGPVVVSPKESNRNSTVFETNDSDGEWSDWEGDKPVLTCLFCTRNDTDFDELNRHIRAVHNVDFDRRTAGFTFYDRVKVVNFIRRQMHLLKCVKCEEEFKISGELQIHMKQENHCDIGARDQWNKPEYFFPTYEDDAFLCSLDDTCDTDVNDDDMVPVTKALDGMVIVHCEDREVCINPDAEALSKEQLLNF